MKNCLSWMLTGLALLGLVNCANPTFIAQAGATGSSAVSRDVILNPGSPDLAYLGGGRQVLTGDVRSQAVSIGEASETVGEAITQTSHFLSKNSFELLNELSLKYGATLGGSIFDGVTMDASIKAGLEASSEYSSNKIVCVVELKYDHAKIVSNANTVVLKNDALQDFNTYGREHFLNNYGDGYVNSATLGERLYMTMTIDGKNVAASLKANFESAAKAKFLDVIGASTDVEITAAMRAVWEQMQAKTQIFASGGFLPPVYVTTPEDFKADYAAFSKFIQDKVNGANKVPFSVVARTYKPYDTLLAAAYTEADTFYRMYLEWKKAQSRVQIVYNDTTAPGLKAQCQTALNTIQIEIQKCLKQDVTSRFPGVNEFASIDAEWLKLVSLITYRVYIYPYVGWGQSWVGAGETAGGSSLFSLSRNLQVQFPANAPYDWTIAYQALPNGTIYWGDRWAANGENALNNDDFIKSVRIKLVNCPPNFSVKYRTHNRQFRIMGPHSVPDPGAWQPWASDGSATSISSFVDSVEMKIVY